MRIEIHHHHHHDPALEHRLDQFVLTLRNFGSTIMTKIADFSTAMTAFFDRQDAAVTDLQGDVKSLSDQIAVLQNSTGAITPEDQASLDAIQARASTISDKLDALDALTPPVAPAG